MLASLALWVPFGGVVTTAAVITSWSFLAQTTTGSGGGSPPQWTLVGVIGVLVSALVWVYKREAAARDRLEAVVTTMLPEAFKATAVMEKQGQLIVDMDRQLHPR